MVKYKSTTYSAAIGERIRTMRKQFGLSQEQLGELADVTYQQIQKYENGTDRISTDRLKLIAEGLKMPIAYFLEEAVPKVKEKEVLYHTIGELSKEEIELIKLFRKVRNREAKARLLKLIKAL